MSDSVPEDQNPEDPAESVADDADKKFEAKPQVASSGGSNVVSYMGQVDIYLDKPLDKYNVNDNKAYKALATGKSNAALFAIVCERHLLPRIEQAKKYSKIINPNMANLVAHGPLFWPPVNQERYVLIYLDNLGQPILQPDIKAALGWKQDAVMASIVKPMVNILQDYAEKDFVHGNIRVTNMFGVAPEGGVPKKILLGDCLSAPASYMQPALYEPIERAMAGPVSRGMGTLSDDLYSFGVSLAVCLRSNDGLAEMSDEAVIREKIIHGSYAAITGKDRFKGEILELLRGLLHDDPGQRWTIDEVLVWMEGHRLTPKQAHHRKKANRPLNFGDEKYILAQTLAMDIDKNPSETRRIVEDDSLAQWVKRSLEDEETLMKIDNLQTSVHKTAGSSTQEDHLVSHLSFALDGVAPLRFKGLRVTGDGLGTAIAEAIILKQDLKVYKEILTSGIMLDWISAQTNANLDISALFNKYEQCRRVIKTPKIGDGFERCVYILAPEIPCLSEKLNGYFVTDAGRMVQAFEDTCKRKKAAGMFLDRHSVGYLMQSEPSVIELQIFDLNTQQEHKEALANLKCFADIQKLYKLDALPHLSMYFATRLASVYESYHDRNVREKIKAKIDAISDGGDLSKMVDVLDDMDLLNKDAKAYRKALEEFAGLQEEKEDLEERIQDKDLFGVETGQDVAAIAASGLAILIIIASAMMFFS